METTAAKKTSGTAPRSTELIALCLAADAAIGNAYSTHDKDDFRKAEKACLDAALLANRESNNTWANEYGKKNVEMMRKACGG